MFRFTIRDVLWLMVVAALLATRSVDRRRFNAAIKAVEQSERNTQERYAELLDKNAMTQWELQIAQQTP